MKIIILINCQYQYKQYNHSDRHIDICNIEDWKINQRKIQQINESACIHRLYALEGAVEGIKKTQLDYETKAELKQFYNEHKL